MIKTDGVPMYLYVKHIKKKRGRWHEQNLTYKVTLRIDRETKIEVTASAYPKEILYMLLGRMSGKRDFYNRVCNFIMDYLRKYEPKLDYIKEYCDFDTELPVMREEKINENRL